MIRTAYHFCTTAAVLAAAAGLQAEGPKLESVFPMGVRAGIEVELLFTGDETLPQAVAVWSPQADVDLERAEDDERVRFAGTLTGGPGGCDLYLLAPTGVSNPLRIEFSGAPEVIEDDADKKNDSAANAMAVPVPCVVNGTIAPGTDTDCYRVELAEGQPLHIIFRSMSLGGAVEPALTVLDPRGREFLHDGGSSSEPVLSFTAPEAGEYVVRVQERAYRAAGVPGYRLWLTDQPLVTAAFPHVLKRGEENAVTLYGYGLPDGEPVAGFDDPLVSLQASISAPAIGDPDGGEAAPGASVVLDGFAYRHPGTVGFVRFGLGDQTLVIEEEPDNDDPESAPLVTLPVDLCGQFGHVRDQDWLRFAAKKGETIWIEAYGQRLGQAMDLEIDIYSSAGSRLAGLSDSAAVEGRDDPLAAATRDPSGTWQVPADGEYRLIVRDLFGTSLSRPGRGYRLQVAKEPPRGCVVVLGQASLRPGGEAALQVVHHGGVIDENCSISVRAEMLPEGLIASELTLTAENRAGTLNVTAAEDVSPWIGTVQLVAEVRAAQTIALPVRAVSHRGSASPAALRRTVGAVVSVTTP